jgi:hypothetical protein
MTKSEHKTEGTTEFMWVTRDIFIDGKSRKYPILIQKFTTTFYVNGVFDREVENWMDVPGTYYLEQAMIQMILGEKGNGT